MQLLGAEAICSSMFGCGKSKLIFFFGFFLEVLLEFPNDEQNFMHAVLLETVDFSFSVKKCFYLLIFLNQILLKLHSEASLLPSILSVLARNSRPPKRLM